MHLTAQGGLMFSVSTQRRHGAPQTYLQVNAEVCKKLEPEASFDPDIPC